jgi:hypothetical protein
MPSLKLVCDEVTGQYASTGTRISDNYPLTNITGQYVLKWSSFEPFSTSIVMETCVSYDGGLIWTDWKTVKNNKPIPDVDSTMDLSSTVVKIKQTLTTTDPYITPELSNVQIMIDHGTEINVKNTWDGTTNLLAKFHKNLEAGNIENDGIKIIGFQVDRRSKNSYDSVHVGDIYSDDGVITGKEFEFYDYTQPNKKLIYSIKPIGENLLTGKAKEIEIESGFVGWWIVDKETNQSLQFDKGVGSIGSVDYGLNQDRTVIDTFAQHPQIYYNGNRENHSFTLQATFLPEDGERSGEVYERMLNNFIRQHKPFIVKSSNGNIFVMDISNPRVTTPLNTWSGYDYINVSVDALEIMTLEEYMADSE